MEKADLKMVTATYFRGGELFLPLECLLQLSCPNAAVYVGKESVTSSGSPDKVTYLGHKQQLSEEGMREHEPQAGAAQGSKLGPTQQRGTLGT